MREERRIVVNLAVKEVGVARVGTQPSLILHRHRCALACPTSRFDGLVVRPADGADALEAEPSLAGRLVEAPPGAVRELQRAVALPFHSPLRRVGGLVLPSRMCTLASKSEEPPA